MRGRAKPLVRHERRHELLELCPPSLLMVLPPPSTLSSTLTGEDIEAAKVRAGRAFVHALWLLFTLTT